MVGMGRMVDSDEVELEVATLGVAGTVVLEGQPASAQPVLATVSGSSFCPCSLSGGWAWSLIEDSSSV